MSTSHLWVLSEDELTIDAALSAAAVAGVDGRRAGPASVLDGTVVLGVDVVADIPARRWEVADHVILAGHDAEQLALWSSSLRLPVVWLPEGIGELTRLAAGLQVAASGKLLGFLGAGGGVGTSTVAASVAEFFASSGMSTVLVDFDVDSPGIDLLLGAEHEPGWRWPDVAQVRGHVGSLKGLIPQTLGLDVLSRAAGQDLVDPEASRVVLRSLWESHDVVVADFGRGHGVPEDIVASAHHTWLVTSASTSTLVQAQMRLRQLRLAGASVRGVVLNGVRGRSASTSILADERVLSLTRDQAVAAGAERGHPPWIAGGGRWRRQVRRLAEAVAGA